MARRAHGESSLTHHRKQKEKVLGTRQLPKSLPGGLLPPAKLRILKFLEPLKTTTVSGDLVANT